VSGLWRVVIKLLKILEMALMDEQFSGEARRENSE
jgi:hypothetical protein